MWSLITPEASWSLSPTMPGLERRSGLFSVQLAGRAGDSPHHRDTGQLTDPLRHLLEVGKGLRRTQVVQRSVQEILRNGCVDREMTVQSAVYPTPLSTVSGSVLRSS